MLEAEETRKSGAAALDGAIAGAVGVVAMDLVAWPMYRGESRRARARERRAWVEGKWANHVAASKVARLFGIELCGKRQFIAGETVHYLMGIVPGMLYGVLRRRAPIVGTGRGLLYGFALYALVDEIGAPLLGIASGPRKYPWQAHLRGLVSHLVMGGVTHAALDALERRRARHGRRAMRAPAASEQREAPPRVSPYGIEQRADQLGAT